MLLNLEIVQLQLLDFAHSFQPDSDFEDIECVVKRHTKMFSPEDYIQVMKSCRRKPPNEVVSMQPELFVGGYKTELDFQKGLRFSKKLFCKKEPSVFF